LKRPKCKKNLWVVKKTAQKSGRDHFSEFTLEDGFVSKLDGISPPMPY
jgi:hypothetical protein